jgi:hypothetical protein
VQCQRAVRHPIENPDLALVEQTVCAPADVPRLLEGAERKFELAGGVIGIAERQ